jgi:catalase
MRCVVFILAFVVADTAMGQAQESVPPTEAADTAKIVATIENAVRGAYALGVRPAMRDAHAKAHGCVRASFAVHSDLPKAYRVGAFAEPVSYKAWIRFSNGSGTPHDDAVGDGRGMALKLIGVRGPKLLADVPEAETGTQDFLMINYPVFFIRNVADYVPFTTLSLQGKSQDFLASHPHEQDIIKAITSKTVDQVFEQRYFSMAPYLLGDRYSKFSARPVDCTTGTTVAESQALPPGDVPNYLRNAMADWLRQKAACFRFAVQLQTDPATQPIEDPTILWEETAAPFFDVATIRIPPQSFESPAQDKFCENLSYTPWHTVPEQRPVGGINRLRRALYVAISALRHQLSRAPSVQPTGDETFP